MLINTSKFKVKFLVLGFVLSLFSVGNTQVVNDECRYATNIPDVANYCSGDAEFTNIGAQSDPVFSHPCVSLGFKNGVWFSFTPRKAGILAKVFGSGNGGTIKNPKILIFEDCNTFKSCSPGNTTDYDELLDVDFTIGQVYYLMVESPIGSEGTFKLCIEEFSPIPFPESDCKSAVVLCDKSPFAVQNLTGTGDDKNEIEAGNCIESETQSVWYKWTCDTAGTLTFTLTPNDFINYQTVSIDLDFALYELPNGIDDCSNKKLLRCMASGANLLNNSPAPLSQWSGCNGPTGLLLGDPDISETAGCQSGNNNFVKEIQMESGKSYVLIVNNFDHDGKGFSIKFGGTGTFLGPKPNFEINSNNKFECDKSVTVMNTSNSLTDPIVSYSWNFGDKSTPNRETGQGPFNVTYASFGDKIAALTVTSSRGCTVTKTLDFYVEPCCKDTSTLDVNAIGHDIICFGDSNGKIEARGISGAPEYKFNIDGGPLQPNPNFFNLAVGDYLVGIVDLKGCKDSVNVHVGMPELIVVDAGPDQEIELGDGTILEGTYTPMKDNDMISWSPLSTPSDSLRLHVMPYNTTTYTMIVTDSSGCVGQDMVEIRVIKNLNLFAPNIFYPDSRQNNNFFNVWGTKGVDKILILEVYDRWGNLVFQGTDGQISSNGTIYYRNRHDSGWNGRFKGQDIVAGVYAWRALVSFLDGTEKNYSGDITLLR